MEECKSLTSVCRDVDLLNLIAIFKIVIAILIIGVFVALIIWVMVDVVKSVASSEVDTKKLLQAISRRLLAGVLVLLVPTIVHFTLNNLGSNGLLYLSCYSCADVEIIDDLAVHYARVDLDKFKLDVDNALLYDKAYNSIKKIKDKDVRDSMLGELVSYKK